MRISVLGQSDSTGVMLPAGTPTWPELVRDQVAAAIGRPVDLDSWRWAPYRPGAAEFALELVDQAQPDLVIFPLAAFWCAYSTVNYGVERRMGARAGRLYRRAETLALRVDGRVIPSAVTRRIARRMLRAAPLLTLPHWLEIHTGLIAELARREQFQVLVLGDHHFSEENRRLMPLIPRAIAEINAKIGPLVRERRLLWADMEKAISAGGRREEMMFEDGVHMRGEAHQRLAAMVAPIAIRFAETVAQRDGTARTSPA